jgi:predicted metal-binding protein
MMRIGAEHGKHLRSFGEKARALIQDSLLLGSGGCKICETCTYPDSPCRFPDRMTISMEAMGLVVSDVCRANNLSYYYGPNTITYTGCVIFNCHF